MEYRVAFVESDDPACEMSLFTFLLHLIHFLFIIITLLVNFYVAKAMSWPAWVWGARGFGIPLLFLSFSIDFRIDFRTSFFHDFC